MALFQSQRLGHFNGRGWAVSVAWAHGYLSAEDAGLFQWQRGWSVSETEVGFGNSRYCCVSRAEGGLLQYKGLISFR